MTWVKKGPAEPPPMTPTDSLPLSGIRVLEFTHALARAGVIGGAA